LNIFNIFLSFNNLTMVEECYKLPKSL